MSIRLWLHPAILAEYTQNAGIRARRAMRGHTRHDGGADAIIRASIDRTWNGRSYTASPGHFHMFWTRDLCFSSTALARISPEHRERLHASLAWALQTWERRNSHVTTTIHKLDWPADVYDYGVDSLPLLVAALRAANATDLVLEHKRWLDDEVIWFADRVVDRSTGLVRADRKFSAHRDTVTNRSNAYGNAMVALLAKTLAETGWVSNPLERHFKDGWDSLLMRHFWRDDRFIDALGDGDTSSGEANLWPFWNGVVEDRDMMATAFDTLRREGYTDPYPLRYETKRRPEIEVWLTRHVLPDYQGSTVWTSLGSMYLQLLREVDPTEAKVQTVRYVEWIERDGTFWEVLDHEGNCWVSPKKIMIGEEAMLWSAIFLDHLLHPDAEPARLSPVAPLAPAVVCPAAITTEDAAVA